MVVNAPTSNIVSAAELAVALMLAAARHVSPAHAALRNGEWKRSKYTGIELYEKTVGIVGLGRIGVLVAQRLSAFGMNVIAYDPYVQAGRAAQMGVRLVDLDTLLAESDFMSVHLPKTPETDRPDRRRAARAASSRRWCWSTPRAAASSTRPRSTPPSRRAGSPPPGSTSSPTSRAPTARSSSSRTSSPPRTSAPRPTRPRRRPASPSPAPSRLALAGELVPDAVNVQGGVIAEDVRPGIPLTEKLGRVFTALAGEVAQQIDVEVRGEITEYDVKVLELAALKGVFTDVVEDQVSYVNAPLLAAERGTAVRLVTEPESPDHRNLITIRGTLADGSQVSVSGTLVGINQRERLVEVNGFDVDIEPTDHLAFLAYDDRPGMVGTVGRILGDAGVNIAGMQVARDEQGRRRPGRALGRHRHPRRDARRDRARHRARPRRATVDLDLSSVQLRRPSPGRSRAAGRPPCPLRRSAHASGQPASRPPRARRGRSRPGDPHEPVEPALGGEHRPGGDDDPAPLGLGGQRPSPQGLGQPAPQRQAAGRAPGTPSPAGARARPRAARRAARAAACTCSAEDRRRVLEQVQPGRAAPAPARRGRG